MAPAVRTTTSDREMFRSMARECVAFRVRRASRIVTRIYDRALAETGLTATQLTLLCAVANRPDLRMAELADLLGFEPSSLSRSLALLVRNKWLRPAPSSPAAPDKRERFFEITASGRDLVRTAWVHWRAAQGDVEEALAAKGLKEFIGTLEAIAAMPSLAPAARAR